MMTKQLPETKQITDFCQKNDIHLCVLFGSQAQANTHPNSDVDIALLPATKTVDKLDLIGQLTDIFQREIDLVIIDSSRDPVLLREIFEKGTCLFEETPGLFIQRKIWAWMLYQDTRPLREFRQKYIQNFVEEVSNGSH